MSYNSDPLLWPFGTAPNVCTRCYPTGRSPDPTILTISGIQYGDAISPGDPAPPNGSWILPATAACGWSATIGPFTFSNTQGLPSTVEVRHTVQDDVFFSLDPTQCITWLENDFTSPVGRKYFGGFAIVKPPQVNTNNNVPSIMDVVGIPAEDQTFVSPRPMTSNQTVYVFSRPRDASNIHVKVATT